MAHGGDSEGEGAPGMARVGAAGGGIGGQEGHGNIHVSELNPIIYECEYTTSNIQSSARGKALRRRTKTNVLAKNKKRGGRAHNKRTRSGRQAKGLADVRDMRA